MERRDFLKGIFATAAYAVASPLLPSTSGVSYPAKSTLTLDRLIDETMRAYRKQLADNIFAKSPLWVLLKEKGYVNELSA